MISVWFIRLATCRGVRPRQAFLMSAPRSSSILTTSTWPSAEAMRRYTSSNLDNVNLVEKELHRRFGVSVIRGRRVLLTKGESIVSIGPSV